MPLTPQELDAAASGIVSQSARASTLAAPAAGPDQVARAMQLKPDAPLAIVDDLDHHEQAAHLDAVDSAAQADPRFAAWHSTPERAALAKDDLGPISKLSSAIGRVWDFGRRNVPTSAPAVLSSIDWSALGQRFQASDAGMFGGVQRMVGDLADTSQAPLRAIAGAAATGAERAGQVDQAAALRAQYADPIGTRAFAAQGADVQRGAQMAQQDLVAAHPRPTLTGALLNPSSAANYYAGMVADSAPAIMAAVATRNPEAAAGMMGLTTQAQGYGQARDEGKGALQAHTDTLATQTLPEVAFSLSPFGHALSDLPFMRRALGTAWREALGEGATEAAQDVSGAAFDGRRLDRWQTFLNVVDASIVGAIMGPSEALGGGDRAPSNAVRPTVESLSNLSRSVRGAQALAASTQAAAEAKLTKRAPSEVAALAADAGHVYVPVEDARALYQQDDFDGFASEITGHADAAAIAGETGLLAIPADVWHSRIAALPNASEWAARGKLDADGYSAFDLQNAERMAAEFPDLFNTDEAATRATPSEPGNDLESQRKAIEQDIYGQLVATGRYRDTEAAANAKLASGLAVTAQRMGADPSAVYQAMGLKIGTGASVLATKPNGLDLTTDALFTAARTGNLPSDALVNGPSLLNFLVGNGGVQDMSGELTGRDAIKQRPGLVNNREGVPLDYAREAAAEAGYLPADSTVADFLDLIDGELRGSPVYSEANRDPKLSAFRDQAETLRREIDEAFDGVTPEAFAKFTNQQIAEALSDRDALDRLLGRPTSFVGKLLDKAKLYAQAAFHGTPHKGIEKFSLDKIGTGEGNQTYGWGLYFASERAVAEHYRGTLGQPNERTAELRPAAVDAVKRNDYLGFETAGEALGAIRQHSDFATRWDIPDAADVAALEAYRNAFGEVHQVDVPDDSDLLDWDKQLSEQPEKVRTALDRHATELAWLQDEHPDLGVHGSTIYHWLVQRTGSPKAASEYLNSLGVPGLRYLDGGSRAAGTGSHNYVIWDEGKIKVEQTFYQDAMPEGDERARLLARVAELEAALGEEKRLRRTSDLTGLRNKLAFEEDEALGWPAVAAMDLDGLKRMNSALGHEGADEVLRAIGAVFAREEETAGDGVKFYHRSGDEFALRAKTPALAEAAMKRLRDVLDRTTFEVEVVQTDGTTAHYIVAGAGISYGLGDSYEIADARAEQDKHARLAAGLRQDPDAPGASQRIHRVARDSAGREGESDDPNAQADRVNDPADGGVSRYEQQPRRDSAPRGQLRLGDDGSFSIDLLQKADASTFIHELGHVYFELMGRLAMEDGASAEGRALFDTLLQHGSIEGDTPEARRATWAAMDLEQRRHLHEAVAEGFEAYLQEGKAPSPELVGAFAQLRTWLLAVYRAIRGQRIPLTDSVRDVFDRMLATDAEIDAVRARQGMAPAIDEATATAGGIDPAQYAAVKAQIEAAREAAVARLNAQALRVLQREQRAAWKAERAKVRAELEAQAEATPAIRAWRVLSGAKIDGLPESLQGLKLDSNAVKAAMPDGKVPAPLLRLGIFGKDGVGPDGAAMLLGFQSGDHLLTALRDVRDTIARLDADADAIMRERHGDPMIDGTLADKAMRAAHNGAQVKALEAELAMLEQLASDPTATPQKPKGEGSATERAPLTPEQKQAMRERAAARAAQTRAFKVLAERRVAGIKVRDLRPNEHLAAERRAALKAQEAAGKGDFVKAATAKREQILAAQLYRAARDAQARAERTQKYLAKFTKKKARAKLGKAGGDYLAQIDGLLERFDLRKLSNKAADRRARFADWIAAKQAAGIPVDVDPKLVDEAFAKPFRELTVGEVRALRDAVDHLAHLARLKNRLLLNGEERDAAEVDAEMAASVRDSHAARKPTTGLPTVGDNVHAGVMHFRAVQATVTDLARELDGFKDQGGVWRHTAGIIRDAVHNRLNPALRDAQHALAALYLKHYTKAELRAFNKRMALPEVNGDVWTKERLLALALNWGNAGNREAILTQARAKLSPEQVGRLLQRLDARDWDFVESAWALIDQHWPAIAEKQRQRTGLAPEKVEPASFVVTLPDGTQRAIRGGYYPLKGEPDSVRTMKDEAREAWDQMRMGTVSKAQTRRGHTIERVGFGGRTVRLDLGVLDGHLRSVLRDLHLGDAVNYVHDALHGPAFSDAIGDAGLLDLHKAMGLWLRDVATGEAVDRAAGARAAKFLRTNFTAAVLTYRVTAALLQVTGFAASLSVVGPTLAHGIRQVIRRPVTAYRYVSARSPMMAARLDGHTDAVLAVSDARAGRLQASHATMIRAGYKMMGWSQSIVDTATWIAAEKDALERGMSDVEARSHADDVVTRAQGAHDFVDKTPLQRGTLSDTAVQSEYIKAVSALSGYMLAKGNLLYEKTRTTKFRSPRQAAKWGANMVMLLAVEQMLAAALTGKLPGDEDDDGDRWDDVAKWATVESFFGLIGTIPGLNSVSGNLRGYGSGGAVSTTLKGFADLWTQWVTQDDMDQGRTKATIKAVAPLTGLPTTQINKTLDAIEAERDGRDVSLADYLNGPPRH